MRQFTPKEILAIEEFLNESDSIGNSNELIGIYKAFQRGLLNTYKKFPKEVEE